MIQDQTQGRDRTDFISPPARGMAAQGILLHPDGVRLLMLDMAHRPCPWLPGGSSKGQESPHDTMTRLAKTQLGLDLGFADLGFAFVDHTIPKAGTNFKERFNHGFALQLTEQQASSARPLLDAGPDLQGFDWLTPDEIGERCEAHHVNRVVVGLRWLANPGYTVIMRNGVVVR
ncbi:hypothetical protein ABT095_15720 [Kitasatospora sp. NPDC002227]|uniref:hypothetical protein n=1 Tax=Kitasatospora sp. NPDC002227 TaxID=3154773 RepID=UPI00332A8322